MKGWLRFRKWDEYQYARRDVKKGAMPWVRLHWTVNEDYELARLSDIEQLSFHKLLALAGKYPDGLMPYDLGWLKSETHYPRLVIDALIGKFLEVVEGEGVRLRDVVIDTDATPDADESGAGPGTGPVPDPGRTRDGSVRLEEKRIEQKRVEPPLTPPAGGTSAAPAAKQRRKAYRRALLSMGVTQGTMLPGLNVRLPKDEKDDVETLRSNPGDALLADEKLLGVFDSLLRVYPWKRAGDNRPKREWYARKKKSA